MKNVRTPLLLFALPALAVALAPALFVYDRAAILHGEGWRLVTGHWVHFSASHAVWNLFALIVATTWLERLRPGWAWRFVALAAPAISLGLLVLAPTMTVYGGLSGLAVGIVTLLALVQFQNAPRGRGWWLAALALIVGKIGWELVVGTPLFARLEPGSYRVSIEAHLLGLLAALLFFAATRCFQSEQAGRLRYSVTETLRGARAMSAPPRGRNPPAAR